MRIDYLANHVELIPQLAELLFQEWRDLNDPSDTVELRAKRIADCCGRRSIPMGLVAVEGRQLCGSAFLIAHDMKDRLELTPWLAGVFVLPEMRRCGMGTALVSRVIEEASMMKVGALYLYTSTAAALYARLGWEEIERRQYRGVDVTVMARRQAA